MPTGRRLPKVFCNMVIVARLYAALMASFGRLESRDPLAAQDHPGGFRITAFLKMGSADVRIFAGAMAAVLDRKGKESKTEKSKVAKQKTSENRRFNPTEQRARKKIPAVKGAVLVSRCLAWCFRAFPPLKAFLWKKGYDFLSKVCTDTGWTFMNYGYWPSGAEGNGQSGMPPLSPGDAANRCCIQLYHHLASRVEIAGKRVLEIGSGRGGGADYLHRYHRPGVMAGIDFSAKAVAFCRKNFGAEKLTFEVGRAEALPCDDGAFDVVFNVESSHCYGKMAPFLAEVGRVLSPGGVLLFADFRARDEIEELREDLRTSGLEMIEETDITANVLAAMDRDHDRKCREIDRRVSETIGLFSRARFFSARKALHRQIVRFAAEFVGSRNSSIYREFETGNSIYISCVMQKTSF